MRWIADGFEITLVLSGATSLAAVLWMVWRKTEGRAPVTGRTRLVLHPWAQFVAVSLLLLVNQVLFNAYVRVAHGGDPSFVATYIPGRWFRGTPDAPLVKLVADHVPAAWLSLSVLRVQAFLELPFALLAYLAVTFLLDRALYRTLVRSPLIVLASASFTAVFCFCEWQLHSPWTEGDLVARVASGILTPAWLWWAARGERGKPHFPAAEGRPRTLVGLIAFFVGAGAVAIIVLVLYDVTLLYNLAHLRKYARLLVVATLVASAAFAGARRADRWIARISGVTDDASIPSSISTSTSALVVFTAVFFVPSLVLRYWGPHPSAVALAVLLVATGVVGGVAWELRTLAAGVKPLARWFSGACIALAVGLFVCATDAMGLVSLSPALPEELLLQKALLLALPAIVAWRAFEAIVGRVPRIATDRRE